MIRSLAICVLCVPSVAHAFPPYRLTDAATADPWDLEARLGARLILRADDTTYGAPSLRVNLGLPYNIEIVSEFELDPVEPKVADAAVGAKFVLPGEPLSFGIEALALLPTSSNGRAGTEASLLATYRVEPLRIHANAAGFYDARPAAAERGWKGGVLGEVTLGGVRPGLELFAKQTTGQDVEVLAGVGAIAGITDQLDVRAGIHLGLTEAAPDLVASLWIAGKMAVR